VAFGILRTVGDDDLLPLGQRGHNVGLRRGAGAQVDALVGHRRGSTHTENCTAAFIVGRCPPVEARDRDLRIVIGDGLLVRHGVLRHRDAVDLHQVSPDDRPGEVLAGVIVEVPTAGDQRQGLRVRRADDLVDRFGGQPGDLVGANPRDRIGVRRAVAAADLHHRSFVQLADRPEDGRANVPVIHVSGHHDVVDLAQPAGLLIPGDDPWPARIEHHAVDDLVALDLGVDLGIGDGDGHGIAGRRRRGVEPERAGKRLALPPRRQLQPGTGGGAGG